MTIRQYCRNTQTNPGTGGGNIVFDLSETAGGASTIISDNLNSETFTERLRWQIDVDDTIDGTSFPTSMQISSLDGTVEYRWRVQRLSSTNAVQASSGYSATFSAAGTNTATLSLSTTWATGDRLALSLEIRRSGGHGNVAITASTTTNSWVDADFAEEEPEPGNIPAVVGSQSNGNSTGSTVTVSLPGSSAAYLAIVGALDADSITPATNWTLVESRAQGYNNYRLYYAQDTDNPGTGWGWTTGAGSDSNMRVLVVGFDQEIAVHQEGYNNSSLVCPDITTYVEALVCRITTFGGFGKPDVVTWPSEAPDNRTHSANNNATIDDASVVFATDDQETPGATGTATYSFSSGGASVPISGTVAIVRADAVPTANAGTDQEVLVDTTGVQLDGSGSGGAGAPFTYEWTQISGTSVTLSSTTVADPTFTAPSSPGTLVFGLTVEDTNSIPSAQDTVTITVTEPQQPVSAYGFNEGSGTTTEDDTGNDFTLTAYNNPGSWSLNAQHGVYAANGRSFFGAIAPSASTPEFTLMAWIYITGGTGNRTILGYSISDLSGVYFRVDGSDRLSVSTGVLTWTSDTSISTDEWVHVAAVYEQGVPTVLYLDAVATGYSTGGSTDSVATINLGNTEEYQVGAELGSSNPFEGQIDDLRVFDAALSQQEIEDWMNTPIEGGTAKPTGLVATAISSSQIDLTWDAVAGATGYDVERDSIVIAYDVPTNSYSDTTGLDPDTQYTYRVRAVLE